MNYYQEPLVNKKKKTFHISNECDLILFTSDTLSETTFIYSNNEMDNLPLILTKTTESSLTKHIDATVDNTILYTTDRPNLLINNIIDNNNNLHPARKIFTAEDEINTIFDNEQVLEGYLNIVITTTETSLFYDNQNQWIIDDNFRNEDDRYIFDYLDIIENYEYINIIPPSPDEMSELDKYNSDLYPGIVKISTIDIGITDTIDEEKQQINLYTPAVSFTYDSLLYEQIAYSLIHFITKEIFTLRLADIDDNVETGTPFMDIFEDIRELIKEVIRSVEAYVNLYGYNYRIYDETNDILYTTEQQPFKIETQFQITDPIINSFIPNGCQRSDILSITKSINALSPENIEDNDSYVSMALFNQDIRSLDLANIEINVNELTIVFDKLKITQNVLPTKLIIRK